MRQYAKFDTFLLLGPTPKSPQCVRVSARQVSNLSSYAQRPKREEFGLAQSVYPTFPALVENAGRPSSFKYTHCRGHVAPQVRQRCVPTMIYWQRLGEATNLRWGVKSLTRKKCHGIFHQG